jgi:hypothetical protein
MFIFSVECKARFTVDTVSADKEIELDVLLRYSLILKLNLLFYELLLCLQIVLSWQTEYG